MMIQLYKKRELSPLEKFADRCTQWVGSSTSLVVHTILFIGVFVLGLIGFSWNTLLLVLTTVVSLEAIYLAILIQISVNRNTRSLEEVEEDIEEIQEDVGDIEESLDELQLEEEGAGLDEPKSSDSEDREKIILREVLEDLGDMQNIK